MKPNYFGHFSSFASSSTTHTKTLNVPFHVCTHFCICGDVAHRASECLQGKFLTSPLKLFGMIEERKRERERENNGTLSHPLFVLRLHEKQPLSILSNLFSPPHISFIWGERTPEKQRSQTPGPGCDWTLISHAPDFFFHTSITIVRATPGQASADTLTRWAEATLSMLTAWLYGSRLLSPRAYEHILNLHARWRRTDVNAWKASARFQTRLNTIA